MFKCFSFVSFLMLLLLFSYYYVKMKSKKLIEISILEKKILFKIIRGIFFLLLKNKNNNKNGDV